MKIAVLGLWHLGSVTAACTAHAGHDVSGWDPDPATRAGVARGAAPIAEPGLDALLAEGLAVGRLRVTSGLADAVADADVVWITFDTPVDDEDRADVEFVMTHAIAALDHLKTGALVVSSSQLPVGSVARLEREAAARVPDRRASFACLPENLRLGKAIEVFTRPDRVVAGVRGAGDRETLAALFAPITDQIVWMSVESAEMTKHAINAFLATSVVFINEIAAICERVGADATEVSRGLKTDQRIGPKAYLGPGAAFAGGTLARDVVTLEGLGVAVARQTPLLSGVLKGNRAHTGWTHRTLSHLLGSLRGRTIAIWGLTYKPGTSTLRRSLGVELAMALASEGARVIAFDPAVDVLPPALHGTIELARDPLAAATGADALVVGTEWPSFREVASAAVVTALAQPFVVDPGRFLQATIATDTRIRYVSVGTPQS